MADITVYKPTAVTVSVIDGDPPADQSAQIATLMAQVAALTVQLATLQATVGGLQGKIATALGVLQA